MEIDTKAEKGRIEAELKNLNEELQNVEARRQDLANEIVRRQGMLMFLEKLGAPKEKEGR